jgi:hypothetical protein
MHLGTWLAETSKEQREQLASICDTTVEYLYQLGGGHRMGSGVLIRRIADASAEITPGKVVSKHAMRPDIFAPENATNAAA